MPLYYGLKTAAKLCNKTEIRTTSMDTQARLYVMHGAKHTKRQEVRRGGPPKMHRQKCNHNTSAMHCEQYTLIAIQARF